MLIDGIKNFFKKPASLAFCFLFSSTFLCLHLYLNMIAAAGEEVIQIILSRLAIIVLYIVGMITATKKRSVRLVYALSGVALIFSFLNSHGGSDWFSILFIPIVGLMSVLSVMIFKLSKFFNTGWYYCIAALFGIIPLVSPLVFYVILVVTFSPPPSQ